MGVIPKHTRRNKRYKLDSTSIHGTIFLASYVKIIDISIGGIALTTEKRLTIGNEYALRIRGKDNHLILKGAVVWSFLSESIRDSHGNVIPIFKTGLKFVDLSAEQEVVISKFIEAHKKELDEKIEVYSLTENRLLVRFQLKDADKGTIQEKEDYKLKNISLSGLLIESEHALKLEDTINMQMTLPDNQTLSFVGRVVTCTMIQSAKTGSYDIGIEFKEISTKDQQALKKFISLLAENA